MNIDFKDWPPSRLAERAHIAEVLLNVADEDAERVASYLDKIPGLLGGVRLLEEGASIADILKASDQPVPVILITDKPVAWRESGITGIKPCPFLVIASDEPLSEESHRLLSQIFQVQRLADSSAPLEYRIGACVKSLLYPILIEKLQRQVEEQRETDALIKHIGKELSVFYHGFNNPLTVLSGNIQLLQILAETMQVPDDIMKPIQDINGISTRFIHDLAMIEELKEMIRDLEQ